jgi:hypothetical protein
MSKGRSATVIHIGYATTLHAVVGCERFFATVFSLKPFLNRLETCLRYRILPVPVVFRRLAFCPHSKDRSFALGYPHCAQSLCCLWNERLPHRRQSVCDLVWRLPKEDVPMQVGQKSDHQWVDLRAGFLLRNRPFVCKKPYVSYQSEREEKN